METRISLSLAVMSVMFLLTVVATQLNTDQCAYAHILCLLLWIVEKSVPRENFFVGCHPYGFSVKSDWLHTGYIL